MATAPEREEDPAPRPAVDLTVSFFPTTIVLNIAQINDWLSFPNWRDWITETRFAEVAESAAAAMSAAAAVVVKAAVGTTAMAAMYTMREFHAAAMSITRIRPVAAKGAVTLALEGPGLQVGSINEWSGLIHVELSCDRRNSFLSFMEDFETGKVKKRLNEKFKEFGYGGELEVAIKNDGEVQEVRKKLVQIR